MYGGDNVQMCIAKASQVGAHRLSSPISACGASRRRLGRLRRPLNARCAHSPPPLAAVFICGDCEKFAYIF